MPADRSRRHRSHSPTLVGYRGGTPEAPARRKRAAGDDGEPSHPRFKSPRFSGAMPLPREEPGLERDYRETVGFADASSAKGFDRIRKRLVGSLTTPFYGGPSPGPLTESNCAVFLEEKMRSMLRTLESGVVQLEKDELVDDVWTTVPDQYTPRRIEMLSEFIQGHLATRDGMDSDEPVEVWSITGDVQVKSKAEVTCTDFLRLLVREQALTSGAKELADAALDAVSRQPNEAWAAAAARVVKGFRATFANADRPFVSEIRFFWRFVTEANMRTLFTRLADVLMPNPSERCVGSVVGIHAAHLGVYAYAASRVTRPDGCSDGT